MQLVQNSTYELLDLLNEANRELYSLVTIRKPMILAAAPITGVFNDGENEAVLPVRPLKLIDVRANKKKVNECSYQDLDDLKSKGIPVNYIISGMKAIMFYPIPDRAVNYTVVYVPDPALLAESDDTGWPTLFEDLLVEYVVGRKQGHMDMVTYLEQRAERILAGLSTGPELVQGYFTETESSWY